MVRLRLAALQGATLLYRVCQLVRKTLLMIRCSQTRTRVCAYVFVCTYVGVIEFHLRASLMQLLRRPTAVAIAVHCGWLAPPHFC